MMKDWTINSARIAERSTTSSKTTIELVNTTQVQMSIYCIWESRCWTWSLSRKSQGRLWCQCMDRLGWLTRPRGYSVQPGRVSGRVYVDVLWEIGGWGAVWEGETRCEGMKPDTLIKADLVPCFDRKARSPYKIFTIRNLIPSPRENQLYDHEWILTSDALVFLIFIGVWVMIWKPLFSPEASQQSYLNPWG